MRLSSSCETSVYGGAPPWCCHSSPCPSHVKKNYISQSICRILHAVFYSTAAMASPVEQLTTRDTVVSILNNDDLKARAESDHIIVGFTRFRRGEVCSAACFGALHRSQGHAARTDHAPVCCPQCFYRPHETTGI
jgi:hypothetical protein